MPSLLNTLEELFSTRDLYEVLELTKAADNAQIRKAYHKASLRVHPDRVTPSERPEATKKFQALGAVYKILSEKDSRLLYDESGEIDEENDGVSDANRDWDQYWRLLFNKITVKDIKDFEEQYRYSKEEDADLKKAYEESKGDMNHILDSVLCSNLDDEERFTETIKEWIKTKQVTEYEAFTKETKASKTKRKKAAKKEAKEAEQAAKEVGLKDGNDDLANMIMQRQKNREKEAEDFFQHLAAKYCKKSKK